MTPTARRTTPPARRDARPLAPGPTMLEENVFEDARHDPSIDVSICVPLFNEEQSVAQLYAEIAAVMDEGAYRYEVIFVSDGSSDESVPRLRAAAAGDPRVRVIELMRNFGQTAAMAAGFDAARGGVIVPMDGDLQNDPRDIPRLVAKLDENGEAPGKWDIVSGWRKRRRDGWLLRRVPSQIANRLIKKLTWTPEINDFGCSLKAYRRQVLADVTLYGEMHRFLPAICKWRGARVTDQVVNHRPRAYGASKYGLQRTFKVLLDLLTVKFLGDYGTKPIYFFGKLAAATIAVSFISLAVAVFQKYGVIWTESGEPLSLNRNIFLLFAMMTFLIGVIFLMMGVLSELMVRIYYESQSLRPYKIRRTFRVETPVGGGAPEPEPEPAGDAVTHAA
ncbi:MAG: glycosyltransferase family 2 protein [Planctomycetota bacterium]